MRLQGGDSRNDEGRRPPGAPASRRHAREARNQRRRRRDAPRIRKGKLAPRGRCFHRNPHRRGKWERIERLAEDRPFLRYSAVLDDRVRPDHADWHGVVLPIDDPWWRTHYPPNGWRCRCTVTQHDAESLERFGWEPSPTRPAHEGITRPWHNERTGEDLRVPVGIDPGWDHNVGRRDSVRAARSVLVEKAADAPVAVARAALRDGWDSYAAAGRAVRETISNAVPGAPGEAAHAAAFRERLVATLRVRRAAGEIEADVEPALPGERHAKAAEAVRQAAALFPRDWVRKANATPLRAAGNGKGVAGEGAYYTYSQTGKIKGVRGLVKIDDHALAVVPDSFGTAIHEYTHHLQAAMRELDGLFASLHEARTAGEKVVQFRRYKKGATGRRDQYIDDYFGREYERWGQTLADEVITMAFQVVLGDYNGIQRLDDMLRDDPGMADLAIGVLMRYNPTFKSWE